MRGSSARPRGCPSARRAQGPRAAAAAFASSRRPASCRICARSIRASARVFRKSVSSPIVTASRASVFGFLDAALPGQDPRPRASPDDLREKVIAGAERLADLGQASGLVVAPLRVDRLGEVSRPSSRGTPCRPSPRGRDTPRAGDSRRRRGSPARSSTIPSMCETEELQRLPELFEDRVAVGQELPGKLEATVHGVQPGERPERPRLRARGSRSPRCGSPRSVECLRRPESARSRAMTRSS